MKTLLALAFAFLTSAAPAQLIFSSVQANGNVLLFEQRNGQITQLPTGAADHRFTTISRGGRFVTFSAVDPSPGGGIIGSGDIYSFDRLTSQTRKIIDHTTLGNSIQQQIFSPVTASRSPDGSLLAYGVMYLQRQGLEANGSGVGLILVDAATGLTISELPAVDDGYQGVYRGISWSPDGNSFVTPSYFPVSQIGNIPISGLGIVRFERNPTTGQFQRGAALSQPVYDTSVLPPRSTSHILPALSPSGTGLAYFEIFHNGVPGAQPAQASLIIANADGSNARVAVNFSPGTFPGGLSWSGDGTQIFYAFGSQPQIFGSFELNIDVQTAQIGSVGTAPGSQPVLVQGLPIGSLLPEFSTGNFGSGNSLNLADARPQLVPTGGGGFIFSASGLDASTNYILESSTTLSDDFTSGGIFSGSAISTGIEIPPQDFKFFRLRLQ